jgi:hypothetical protein
MDEMLQFGAASVEHFVRAPPVEKVFDFSFVRKAHAALRAKGWQPVS